MSHVSCLMSHDSMQEGATAAVLRAALQHPKVVHRDRVLVIHKDSHAVLQQKVQSCCSQSVLFGVKLFNARGEETSEEEMIPACTKAQFSMYPASESCSMIMHKDSKLQELCPIVPDRCFYADDVMKGAYIYRCDVRA